MGNLVWLSWRNKFKSSFFSCFRLIHVSSTSHTHIYIYNVDDENDSDGKEKLERKQVKWMKF